MKIDIYTLTWGGNWEYKASTNWSKTCKAAKAAFLQANPDHKPEKVKTNFSKK